MTGVPEFCRYYVGTLFREKGRGPYYDCWGLARVVLRDQYGIEDLPDYVDSYLSCRDKVSVSAAVRDGLMFGWRKVDKPQPGCLVILMLAGRPWHCGVMVASNVMLHTTEGTGAVIERIDSLQWKNRIEGFYERS
jgi:cell wall-associated NlpC family hydrolase